MKIAGSRIWGNGLSTEWGVWWWEDFGAVPAFRRRFITALVTVFGFLASWFLIGDLAGSKLGLTDENDLPQYVGTRGHIEFSDIPRLLIEKTEVGQFGQIQRFRPVYYIDRLIETALWGLDGNSWYRWRIVMFGMVIATMLWLCTQFAGLALGAIVTAYTLSFWMWADIWARSTGSNEQDASLGTALFALGAWFFVKRWRNGTAMLAPSIAVAVGAIIAMGSKENMLLLEVPLCVALSAGLWRRRIGWGSAAALAVAMAFGVWVASAIVVYFLGAKVEDIYGNSLHASLLRSPWMVFVYKGVVVTAISAMMIDFLLRKIGDRERLEQYRSLAWRNIFYASVIVAVFVFNFLFYTGRIPSSSRYDFPALLALPALFILLLKSLGETAGVFGFGVIARKATGLVLAILLVVHTVRAPWVLPSAAKEAVARNSAFDAGLQEARRMTREHPQWPIFVESFNYLDYELVQALGFFFIASSINNPRYLFYVANPSGEPRDEFQSSLDRALLRQSSLGFIERGYSPLADAPAPGDGSCFTIVFRKTAQFALDQAKGIDLAAARQCARIPMLIYWVGGELHFDPPPNR